MDGSSAEPPVNCICIEVNVPEQMFTCCGAGRRDFGKVEGGAMGSLRGWVLGRVVSDSRVKGPKARAADRARQAPKYTATRGIGASKRDASSRQGHGKREEGRNTYRQPSQGQAGVDRPVSDTTGEVLVRVMCS